MIEADTTGWTPQDCLAFAAEAEHLLGAQGYRRDQVEVRVHPDLHCWLLLRLPEEHLYALRWHDHLVGLSLVVDTTLDPKVLAVTTVAE